MPLYAKIDVTMPWNDKVAGLPSDGARWAYLKVILIAKQRESPDFTKPGLIDALGAHSRHLSSLVAAGLIDVRGKKYAIHDFDQWQTPFDKTAAERQARLRERRRNERESSSSPHGDNDVETVTVTRDVTEPVTRDVTRDVRRDVTVQSRAEVIREREVAPTAREAPTTDDVPDEESELVDVLVRAGVWKRPTKKMIGFLSNLVRDHGQTNVEQAIATRMKQPITDAFMGDVAALLRDVAVSRTNGNERSRVEANRRQIERDQEQIEAIRSEPDAEAKAAERRAALKGFADGLSFPSAPKPRSQEGRASQ
jgi:hypothetical protein